MCGQVPGTMRKRVMMSLIVGITPLCSPALEHLWVFTGPCMDHQNIDLKQRDYQIFLQQTYIYSGSAENCKYQQAHQQRIASISKPISRELQVSASQSAENCKYQQANQQRIASISKPCEGQ